MGQPSSKTDYVVLGDNAGPSKIAAIKKHGIRTVSEDEFLNLIATRKGLGNGKIDEKTKKKMEKEQEAIKQAAREMERREEKEKADTKHAGGRFVDSECCIVYVSISDRFLHSNVKTVDLSSQLWTTRYAPQSLKDVCGNKGQVEKLQLWLHDWCVYSLSPKQRLILSLLQVHEFEGRVQEAREEWYERISCCDDYWITRNRKDNKCSFVCQA